MTEVKKMTIRENHLIVLNFSRKAITSFEDLATLRERETLLGCV